MAEAVAGVEGLSRRCSTPKEDEHMPVVQRRALKRKPIIRHRRFAATLLLLAIAALMVVGAGSTAPTRTHSSELSIKGLKVGYMTITPIDQGSWDPQEYIAFHKVAVANHWNVQMAQTVPASQAEQVLTGFAVNGAQLIFVTSQTFESAVRAVAPKFPKVKFFVMDDVSQPPLANEGSYALDWYQFGYLGGAAAGLVTKSGKIGLITGQPLDASAKAFGAAQAGARYFFPKAQRFVSYTNDWLDPAKGAAAASALISQGVDVTFAIAGPMSPAILRADAQHHVYGIGSYTDESKFAPGAVPASVLLNWKVAYNDLAKKLTSGTWKASVQHLTITNGGLGVSPFKGVANAAAKTLRLNGLVTKIRAGKVKVPHTKLKG